jgi:membrane-bound metal-dependent hydrolase YbcI (DUF457 family)
MDNVTHTLFALTLARTPLGRGRGTTAALVLSSSAPDIDFVAALGGGASYLEWHRGPTHGPLGVVGLGLVTAAMVWGAATIIGHRSKGGGPGSGSPGHVAPFMTLLVASTVGVLAHILMDLPTPYGTRLLSPFSWRWFALDLMPIVDVYLLAALAGGLLLGWATRARETSVVIVLALMAANYGLRGVMHQDALRRTERLFGPTLPRPCDSAAASAPLVVSWPGTDPAAGALMSGSGQTVTRRPCRIDTAAVPTFLSPLRWRVIAQLTDAYEIYDINLLDSRLRSRTPPLDVLTAVSTRVLNHWTPLAAEAARSPTARALLEFSRFPRAQILTDPSGGTSIRFTDMRFSTGRDEDSPMEARRSSLFTATVRVGH